MEKVLRKDAEWATIDGELCKVIEFNPFAKIENGDIISVKGLPYASVHLQCVQLPGVYQSQIGFFTSVDSFSEARCHSKRGSYNFLDQEEPPEGICKIVLGFYAKLQHNDLQRWFI